MDRNTDSERLEENSDSERLTTDNSSIPSSLEPDLKSIINKISPILGPLSPGQSRKIKYEKGSTAVEVKTPIEHKEKFSHVDKIYTEKPERKNDKDRKIRCDVSEASGSEYSKRKEKSTDECSTVSSKTFTTNDSKTYRKPESHPPPYQNPQCSPCECFGRQPYMVMNPAQFQAGYAGVEPEAKKMCVDQCLQNYDRYNYNPVDYGRKKRKGYADGEKEWLLRMSMQRNLFTPSAMTTILFYLLTAEKIVEIKWSNWMPSFPSVPSSHQKCPEGMKYQNFNTKKDSNDDSGMTLPQFYQAKMTSGPNPSKFTFRAVTGIQDGFDEQLKQMRSKGYIKRTPTQSETMMKPETRHYPRLAQHNPYVRAGPYDHTFANHIESNNHDIKVMQPFSHHSISHKICDECQKHGDISKTTMPSGLLKTDQKYDVDPEKARAFLGEKGEGYISVNTIPERVDVYCFDQLNTGYFRTSDHPPPRIADVAVETTEAVSTRFWAEIFGFVHIVFAFFTTMFLQLFKFILTAIVRPILIGIVQLFSDYFIKPLLTVIYNGFTQPISIFLYNVLASIRDIANPIAKSIGYFIEPFVNLVKAFRLVEVKQVYTGFYEPEKGTFKTKETC